jgi:hypothetical protein
MDKELGVFRNLILWLFDQYQQLYRDPDTRLREVLNLVPDHLFVRFSERSQIEKALPSPEALTTDFANADRFLYLPPIERGTFTIPVISLWCDFGKSLPLASIRLVLLIRDSEDKLRRLGYRFETPHGEGEGRHDFYHVQPIQNVFRSRVGYELSCPPWMPDTHPSFALDARDPVMLLLCALISLYGIGYVETIARSGNGQMLKSYLKKCHFTSFPAASFWNVTSTKGGISYKTWYPPAEFKSYCTKKFGKKYKCEPITPETYYAKAKALQDVA